MKRLYSMRFAAKQQLHPLDEIDTENCNSYKISNFDMTEQNSSILFMKNTIKFATYQSIVLNTFHMKKFIVEEQRKCTGANQSVILVVIDGKIIDLNPNLCTDPVYIYINFHFSMCIPIRYNYLSQYSTHPAVE